MCVRGQGVTRSRCVRARVDVWPHMRYVRDMTTRTLTLTLPDARTPATYGARGYGVGVSVVQPGLINGANTWTVFGPADQLAAFADRVNSGMHASGRQL